MTGRPPRPTKIKILEGEPNKNRINRHEPKATGRPYCPKYLDKAAQAEWYRICPILNNMGLLAASDRALVANYCQSYSRVVKYEKIIAEKGELYKTSNGNIIMSPAYLVLSKERDMLHKFSVELGLTPSARSRIMVNTGSGQDAMDKLLSTRKN